MLLDLVNYWKDPVYKTNEEVMMLKKESFDEKLKIFLSKKYF